jgi:hypothetical protein
VDTIVRERAERVARNAGMDADAIWKVAETSEGELCLVSKRMDGVWRGFSACGNMAWGPMEAHEDYTYEQFERAMIKKTDEVIRELKARDMWAAGVIIA